MLLARSSSTITSEEVDWIKANWLNVTAKDISQKLKVNECTVRYLKKKYNLPPKR